MRLPSKLYTLGVTCIVLFILAITYFQGSQRSEIRAHPDEIILNKLSLIDNEQQKGRFLQFKSERSIDQEVANQLKQKQVNITKDIEINIRNYFDNLPTSKPYTKNLTSHPFFNGFVIENSGLCQDQPIDILVYVHSAINRGNEREVIRKTWGSTRLFHDIVVKTIFVLGLPLDLNDQTDINIEHSVYGDIVQGKFNDTFGNIPLKAITTLAWINKHCSQAKTVLKTDDDMFVDIFRVVKEFVLLLDPSANSVVCDLIKKAKIARNPKNRWYVPKTYLPSAITWPPFCTGYFLLVSGTTMQLLYERSFQAEKFVPIDDAYLFGVLTNGLTDMNATNVHSKISHLGRPDPLQELKTNGKFEYLAFEMPANAVEIWDLKLKMLTVWERSHSLYVKLFGSSGKDPVVID